jgi:hypothetical protein
MLVLLMAAALRDQLPSIVFEQSNELAELHSSIVPRFSAGPCPDESGERERRPSDDNLMVRAIPGSAPPLRIPAYAGIRVSEGVQRIARTGGAGRLILLSL